MAGETSGQPMMGLVFCGFFRGFKKPSCCFFGLKFNGVEMKRELDEYIYIYIYRGPSCSGCSCFDMIDVDFQTFNLPQIRYLDMKKYPPGKELIYPTEPEREQTLTQTYLEWGYVTVPSTVRGRSK